MRIFNFLVFSLMSASLFGQQYVQSYFVEKDHPSHKLNFYSDGRYMEYYTCWADDIMAHFHNHCMNISSGTYVKCKGNYVLTSDAHIPCTTDTIQYLLSEPISKDDSIVFIFESPYEELLNTHIMFESPDGSHLIPDTRQQREKVYFYNYSIICATDSLSRDFELKFNSAQKPDTSNKLALRLPPKVEIKALHLQITWRDTSHIWCFPIASSGTTIFIPSSAPAFYLVCLPQFDAFYLATKKYQGLSTKRHKANINEIIFDGKVYVKNDIGKSNRGTWSSKRKYFRSLLRGNP